ncbi:helix-turn-helix domain-containing protein [Alicyclobacillus fodiniaquatilis]|uniref:Helix-turn-helix domain-containing protein n=1 Tax=Alicyclobacillus fodiniaquatilis TaxID=1661150 RepID=A0ABW4JNG8_9BACL
MNSKQINVSDQVKLVRKSIRLTQQQFADLLDVHPITVSQWETGRRTMDAEMYRKVERVHKALNGVTDKERALSLIRQLEQYEVDKKDLDTYPSLNEVQKVVEDARALGCNVDYYDELGFEEEYMETTMQNVQITSVTDVMKLLMGQRVALIDARGEDTYAENEADEGTMIDGYFAALIAATLSNKPYGLFWATENGKSGIRISDENLDDAKIVAQQSKEVKFHLARHHLTDYTGKRFGMPLSLATIEEIQA